MEVVGDDMILEVTVHGDVVDLVNQAALASTFVAVDNPVIEVDAVVGRDCVNMLADTFTEKLPNSYIRSTK